MRRARFHQARIACSSFLMTLGKECLHAALPMDAVSYTHLDVYKRQMLLPVSAIAREDAPAAPGITPVPVLAAEEKTAASKG